MVTLVGFLSDPASPAVTHFFWSDGAWVVYNAEDKDWTAFPKGVPHPDVHPHRFTRTRLSDLLNLELAPEVAVDD